MNPRYIRIAFLLLSLFVGKEMFGQTMDSRLEKWHTALSTKNDLRLEQFWATQTEIATLDSINRCAVVMDLQNKQPKRNYQYAIKLNLLRSNLIVHNLKCKDDTSSEALLKESFRLAYEMEDDYFIATMHEWLFHEFHRQDKMGLGGMHGLIAKEMQETQGIEHFPGLAYSRHFLGHIFYHTREYDVAIPIIRQSIEGFSNAKLGIVDSLDNYYKMNSWNTLGLCYDKLERYDSAIIAFRHGLKIALQAKELFWTGLIQGNMGEVFFKQGRYDTAEVLLTKDIVQSKSSGVLDNMANSMQLLARIDVAKGEPVQALQKLREAKSILNQQPNNYYKANIYEAFGFVFHELGNTDSLYYYTKEYQVLHDSLERVKYDSRAEFVNLRLENQEAVHKILGLNKEKRRVTLIRNFTIGIILLLTGLAYVDFKRQKLKIRLEQQQALEAKKHAEIEAAAAHEQLKDFTLNMIEKSALIETLQQQITSRELSAEQHQIVTELSQQTILTDADWDKFKVLFEKVYPGFFMSMRGRASDITLAELRIAALIRLQLTTKESASMLGVAADTIHKTRQRLKQRLQLSPEADLDGVIASV